MTSTNYKQNIQDLIDAMPDMIIVMHRDGTILEIHGEDPEKLIMSADELIGTSIKTCFDEEEFNRHLRIYEHCIATQELGIIEFELNIRGEKQFFESRIKALDADRLLTIVRDMSSQKKLIEAHEEDIAYRKFLFENDNNGLAIFNNEHKVIDVNPQFCRMTGYSADELKIMYTWDFDALSSKQDIIRNFNINQDFDRTFTSRHRRKDGSTYEVEVSAISFHWQGERFVYTSCRDITERNLINQDLLNTKANLTAIVENTLDSIWSINRKYEITYINDVFAEEFNATFGVLLKPGANILESLPTAIQPKWKSRYDSILAGERILFEDAIEASGITIYIEVAANPINKNNEVIGASFFGRNITDRRLAEKQLINQKQYLETIIETTVDGFWIVNLQKKILQVNNAYCKMSGYSRGELLSMQINDIDSIEAPADTKARITRIIKNGSEIFETKHRRKDGSIFDVEISVNYLDIDGGQLFCFCRDITDRITAANELQKSNERLEALLEISSEITSSAEQSSIMQRIVDSAIRIVGIDSGAVYLTNNNTSIKLSATYPPLPSDFPDDLRIASLSDHPHIEKAIKTGKSVLIADSSAAELTPQEQEIINIRNLKTNLFLPIKIRKQSIGVLILSSVEKQRSFTSDELKLLQGFANQAAHIIDNARNYAELKKYALELEQQITQREKAERELIIAKEKAEESNRLKTAFINNISHEVRTPLNGILGFGNLIMEKDLSYSEKQDYYNLMQHSSERLQQTITDIVDISEITAGTITPRENNVSLSELIKKLGESTREACSKKNILVTREVPPQHKNLVLQTDEELLVKIMKQLLSNAEKFTASGRISLGYDVQNNWVHFVVRDTGRGIAADKLNLMFEPFMQEDVSVTRGHEGSGLGLSIARGLVELLGGEIRAESKKGEGSTFFFTLPYVVAASETELAKPVRTKTAGTDNNLILIAEDEESNYMLLKTVAERAGFSTLHAIHGAEAVELCHQYPEIGLILMDIKMPVMNGLEATKQIKAFRPELPVIALTAHAQTGDRQRMLDAGCDEYLAKPIMLQELNTLIKKMIT